MVDVPMVGGKLILCLDFDGVIHSYASGWKGADVIPDPPVPGAIDFLRGAVDHFKVMVFSSRSNLPGGIDAMRAYLEVFLRHEIADQEEAIRIMSLIDWPIEKPPAFIGIDDRVLTFDGTWPSMDSLKSFQPWNKRPPSLGATGQFSEGKISEDDEGDLRIAIGHDPEKGIVMAQFGKPIAWIGMPPANARRLAQMLLDHAAALEN